MNLISPGGVRAMTGSYLVSPKMTTTETCHYRGYEIRTNAPVVELVCGHLPHRAYPSWRNLR